MFKTEYIFAIPVNYFVSWLLTGHSLFFLLVLCLFLAALHLQFHVPTAYLCIKAHSLDRWKIKTGAKLFLQLFLSKKNNLNAFADNNSVCIKVKINLKEALGCFCLCKFFIPGLIFSFCLIGSYNTCTNTHVCPRGRTIHNKVFTRLFVPQKSWWCIQKQ